MTEGATEEQPARRQLELSVPQVAGSALAAIAAAVLASQLGVYGTVIGAGVVSVVATCGGTIFQFLFKRTGEQIRDVTVQVKPKGRPTAVRQVPVRRVPGDADPDAVPPTVAAPWPEDLRTQAIQRLPEGADPDATRALPVTSAADDPTRVLGTVRAGALPGPRGDSGPHSVSAPAARSAEEFTDATTHGARKRARRRSALAAAVVFVVAMLGITTFELISGQELSGGRGTTVGNSFRGGHEQPRDPSPGTSPEPADSPSPDATAPDDGGTDPGSSPSTPPTGGGDRQPSAGPSTGDGSGPDDGGTKPAPRPSVSPSGEPTGPSPEPSDEGDGDGTDGGGDSAGDDGAGNDGGAQGDGGNDGAARSGSQGDAG